MQPLNLQITVQCLLMIAINNEREFEWLRSISATAEICDSSSQLDM